MSSAATLASQPERHSARAGVIRSTLVLAGSSAAAQGLLLAASPILTRLYTPEQFGMLGTYTAICGTLVVVAGLRFDAAIPLPRDNDDAARLMVMALSSALVLAMLVTFGVTVAGDAFASALGVPSLATWLWLLPFGVLGGSAYQAFSYWHIRQGSFLTLARTKPVQSVTAVFFQLGLGGLAGPAGLFIGDIAQRSAGTVSLAHDWASQLSRQIFSPQRFIEVAKAYRKFPLLASWSAVANALPLIGLPALFAALYGAPAAGAVVVAQRLVDAPVALIGAAAGQVFFGNTARAVREDPRKARTHFDAAVRRLVPCAALLVLGSLALPPLLFTHVFGTDWDEAGRFVQILGVAAAFRLVVSPVSTLAWIAGRQGAQTVGDVLRIVGVLSAVALAHEFVPGQPWAAVAAYTTVMSASYIAFFLLYRHCATDVSRKASIEVDGGTA